VLLLAIIGAFIWAVRSGQFEDLDTPPLDILGDASERDGHDDAR
jgi:cbb3-type cytochrome oxidase maturation protein